MATHWHHPSARNSCSAAADPRERMTTVPGEVTCPQCRAAAQTFARATDETLKSAPAVSRRVVTP